MKMSLRECDLSLQARHGRVPAQTQDVMFFGARAGQAYGDARRATKWKLRDSQSCHFPMTPTMAPSAVALAEEDAIPIQQAKDNALGDAIEKIIIACEGRKDARSAVFEASKKDTMDDQSSASGAALLDGGGSLSSNEIAHLSRLCTAVSSFTLSDRNDVARGFGAVDGELLASLFQLLEEHVRSAAHVDLVNEACQALEPSESGESVKITIDEVSRGR